MKGVAPPEVTGGDIWKAVTPYVIVDILWHRPGIGDAILATIVPTLMGMK